MLVRSVEDPGAPRAPKDALDALHETLEARGLQARVVELVPRGPKELRPLERLHGRVAARVRGGVPRGHPVVQLGGDAGEVVTALGADAVVLYHREDARAFPAADEPPPLTPGLFPPVPAPVVRRPLGALTLVDRHGSAATFDWGAPGADLDPDAAVNAAEAIDELVKVLAGGTVEEDG